LSVMVIEGKSTTASAASAAAKRCQGRPKSAIMTVGARASLQVAPLGVKPSEQWHTAVPLTLMQSALAGQPEVPLAHSSMSGRRGFGSFNSRVVVSGQSDRWGLGWEEGWKLQGKGSVGRMTTTAATQCKTLCPPGLTVTLNARDRCPLWILVPALAGAGVVAGGNVSAVGVGGARVAAAKDALIVVWRRGGGGEQWVRQCSED
jgi:hypothetical protein